MFSSRNQIIELVAQGIIPAEKTDEALAARPGGGHDCFSDWSLLEVR